MEEISNTHFEAIQYLAKANYDLAQALNSALGRQYADAYHYALRVQASMRMILEEQQDLTDKDKNEK